MPRPFSALVSRATRLLSLAAFGLSGLVSIVLLPGRALHAQTPSGVDPNLKFYTHGDPSPDEQYLLELINSARANPKAEGQMLAGITDATILSAYHYFTVNTDQLRQDFASYAAKPPLAFNSRLMASSRAQSLDQAAHGFQGHDGTNGSTFDGRVTATGYPWSAVGENVYAYVSTPFFGFVGMETDWGVPSLDHRVNMMNSDASRPVFKETGISCVKTSAKGFGPLVITQDFATPIPDTAILLGVVYDDTDGNAYYSPGEGAARVIVTSPQSSFYTITSASGGYALPLDEINGGSTAQIVFNDGHGHHITRQVAFGNNVTDNIKVDLITSLHGGSFSALSVASIRNASRTTMKRGKLQIMRDGPDLSQELTVHYQVSGSAVAGQDYKALKGWTTIPAGKTSATVKVRPMPDATPNTDDSTPEKLVVTLQSVDQDPLMAMGTDQASLMIN